LNSYGYVLGNPIKYFDPIGEAVWKVRDVFSISVIVGIGGTYSYYTLESPCINGYKTIIKVVAIGASVGLGFKCKYCFTAPAKVPFLSNGFDDRNGDLPDPTVFSGGYVSAGAGGQLMGVGGEAGGTGLGGAVSLDDANATLGMGTFGAEISGSIGTSSIVDVREEKCGCDAE